MQKYKELRDSDAGKQLNKDPSTNSEKANNRVCFVRCRTLQKKIRQNSVPSMKKALQLSQKFSENLFLTAQNDFSLYLPEETTQLEGSTGI